MIFQGFTMCLMEYDYVVLDNAFLIHKSGIKKHKEQNRKFGKVTQKTNVMKKKIVKPELIKVYGDVRGCML